MIFLPQPLYAKPHTCEQERLHAENIARATARRTREEAEARDKAAAAANAADLAKQEAVNCLQRLQKQHAEQVTYVKLLHRHTVR